MKENGIRESDAEALNWIRDNTRNEALILSDRAILTDNGAYYLYGIFSERQQYIEGINMLDNDESIQPEILRRKKIVFGIFNNEKSALNKLKEERIDYIVQTTDISVDFEYNQKYLILEYNTFTMNIYRVKK